MLGIPDPISPIAVVDATDLATAIALTNEIKDVLNNDVFLKINLLLESLRRLK